MPDVSPSPVVGNASNPPSPCVLQILPAIALRFEAMDGTIEHLSEWTKDPSSTPKVVNLSRLFSPQSFLTAILDFGIVETRSPPMTIDAVGSWKPTFIHDAGTLFMRISSTSLSMDAEKVSSPLKPNSTSSNDFTTSVSRTFMHWHSCVKIEYGGAEDYLLVRPPRPLLFHRT